MSPQQKEIYTTARVENGLPVKQINKIVREIKVETNDLCYNKDGLCEEDKCYCN